MCWSVESSAISAVYGYAVAYYLCRRCYSRRDRWYSLFLATFTTTQVIDAFFWMLKGDSDTIPCVAINSVVSRFVIPPVIFFQPITLTLFPSDKWPQLKWPYRVVTVLAACIPAVYGGCTTIYHGHMPLSLPTLLYDGVQPPLWMFVGACAFWGLGAYLWCAPDLVWHSILAIGGLNLGLLYLLDGTIQLVSKLCFWCLLLSIFFLLDPHMIPPAAHGKATVAAASELTGSA